MEMERRDVLKAVGAVAGTLAAAASGAGLGASQAGAAECEAPGGNAVVGIKSPDPGAFIAGRFTGKTFIVTGSARGMGAAAAARLAREGANVVGVDWLKDQGEAASAAIREAGGASVFVYGDIGDAGTGEAAVAAASSNFGGPDGAINNAGVMDGVFPARSRTSRRSGRWSSPRSTRRRRSIGPRSSEPMRSAPSSRCGPSCDTSSIRGEAARSSTSGRSLG